MRKIQQAKQVGPTKTRLSHAVDDMDVAGRSAFLAEVEILVRGRARDMVLSDSLRELYFATSWGQRSRIARSWLGWVSLVCVGASGLHSSLEPELLTESLLMMAIFVPVLFAALARIWGRPRPDWVEGLTVPLAILGLIIAGGVLGRYSGGLRLHDNLGITLLASTTAVVIFPVTLTWTIIGAATAVIAYTGFALFDQVRETKDVVAYATAFAVAIGCLIPARKSMNILLQHAFLLTLRGLLQSNALEDANLRLAILASTDPLTGLPNRRAFEDSAEMIWHRPGDPSSKVGIVMLDIDHFKRLNDTVGHAAGDRCLAAVAGAIKTGMHDKGTAARYGGEEFICIVRDATPEGLAELTEDLRASIEAMAWSNPGLGSDGIVTVSAGAALGEPDGRPEGLASLVERADGALYRAKATGRNRTHLVAADLAWLPLDAEGPTPKPATQDRRRA